jgi:beta-N-acetylhexosaminidase
MVLLCNQSIDGGTAVDQLLDGLADAQAQGRWLPSAASEARRQLLLPASAPLGWDELMRSSAYQHALDRLV